MKSETEQLTAKEETDGVTAQFHANDEPEGLTTQLRANDEPERLTTQFAESLLRWYQGVRRDLPWRTDPTPYHVWISEIMLQQTRIEAVKGYYARFLAHFPEITDLAEAEEQQVMKMWEGLGYYSRARNLRKAAGICRDQYDGQLPADAEKLRALPGIGAYTAGAVASIAFCLPEPAVDGNVMRVISRYLADPSDISKDKTKREMEAEIRKIMPRECPGDFNQALMELGETVCIPSGRPLCEDCPLEGRCMAHRDGTEEQYPVKNPKKPRKIEQMTVLLVHSDGKYALRRRPEKGLLAGMYEYPWLEGCRTGEQVEQWFRDREVRAELTALPEAVHIFSHVEWHMTGWLAETDRIPAEEGWICAGADEIRRDYPVPTAMKKYEPYIV